MIAVYGQTIDPVVLQRVDGNWRNFRDVFFYTVLDSEYVYEDKDHIVLIDTPIDKNAAHMVDAGIRELLSCYQNGVEDYELFLGAYFIILFDKKTRQLSLLRDPSGIKTGYYHSDGSKLWVGGLLNEVAKAAQVQEFDEEAIYQLLYTHYVSDGYTYYCGVHEHEIGRQVTYSLDLSVSADRTLALKLADEENSQSVEENTELLREEICRSLHKHSCGDNVVLLSGGIDSVVMLAALDELRPRKGVRAVSYRVIGSDQDETAYAKDIADHVGTELDVVDIDPNDVKPFDRFEETILQMNNPYFGVWFFGDFVNPSLTRKYFAGQDTRLHTPDMNFFDRLSYSVCLLRKSSLMNLMFSAVNFVTGPIRRLDLNSSSNLLLKGMARLCEVFDTSEYLTRFVFKCDRNKARTSGLPMNHFDKVKRLFELDLESVESRRQLYNEVTKIRWKNQFINNIRYLDDLARLNGTHLSVPFYDARLSMLSSELPFGQVTKRVIGRTGFSKKRTVIDKYMLRMAFKDKLTDKVFYRQKAVSMVLPLFFEGALGRKLREVINTDLQSTDSFLKKYHLQDYVMSFLSRDKWGGSDFKYMFNICYLAAFCVYNRRIIGKNSREEESAVSHSM